MINVAFKKPEPSADFDDWLKRCDEAANKVSGAGGVSAKLYKEQRHVFLDSTASAPIARQRSYWISITAMSNTIGRKAV